MIIDKREQLKTEQNIKRWNCSFEDMIDYLGELLLLIESFSH